MKYYILVVLELIVILSVLIEDRTIVGTSIKIECMPLT
jgi:hypothetical protein